MNVILSIDVLQTDQNFMFTMHYGNKNTTFEVRSLSEGFKVIEGIVRKKDEDKILLESNFT